jgi:hypothetical protein
MARRVGAIHIGNSAKDNPVTAVRALTGGGVDVIRPSRDAGGRSRSRDADVRTMLKVTRDMMRSCPVAPAREKKR